MMAFSKDEIQNLSDLFLSVNDDNTKLAFEIMGNKNFPKELIFPEASTAKDVP
jgi:hypothetical protein